MWNNTQIRNYEQDEISKIKIQTVSAIETGASQKTCDNEANQPSKNFFRIVLIFNGIIYKSSTRLNLGPSGAGSVNIVKHHKIPKKDNKTSQKSTKNCHECGLIFAFNTHFVCKHRGVIQINSYVLGLGFFWQKKAEDR